MPLVHCTVYTGTLRKEMFLVIVQKQQQYVTGHASFWAVSSKTSDWLPTYVVSRWDGITSWWLAAKRRWRLEAVVETGMQHAARYREAEPYRHRRVITPSEFVLDTLSYVKPVELSMHQLPQTAVELPWLTNWQPHPCTAVSPQYICHRPIRTENGKQHSKASELHHKMSTTCNTNWKKEKQRLLLNLFSYRGLYSEFPE